MQNSLLLRPFPIGILDRAKREETYRRYRHELVSQAGIAVFIMGNKYEDGKLIDSEGVRHEFELAKEKGLYIVPVGGLGGMSAIVATEVLVNFREYYPQDDGTIEAAIKALNGPIGEGAIYLTSLRAILKKLAKE